MGLKLMMTGTAVMFLSLAGMVVNRVSEGALSRLISQLACQELTQACQARSDVTWVTLMAAVFFVGVAINIWGRIRSARDID